MAGGTTRRGFLQTVATAGALGAALPSSTWSTWASLAHASAAELDSPGAGLDRRALETELRRRASWQLRPTRLVVDYYRVGRRIAYPLPLTDLVIPNVTVPTIRVYPWATWLLWTLEERITCLGWAAEWFEDERARKAATADLQALAQWPGYQQYSSPDLSSAHAGRVLWCALTRWRWVGERLVGVRAVGKPSHSAH